MKQVGTWWAPKLQFHPRYVDLGVYSNFLSYLVRVRDFSVPPVLPPPPPYNYVRHDKTII